VTELLSITTIFGHKQGQVWVVIHLAITLVHAYIWV